MMAGMVKTMAVDTVMGNFLQLLVEKKRAEILPEIAEAFQVMVDEEKNISHGSVITSYSIHYTKLYEHVDRFDDNFAVYLRL